MFVRIVKMEFQPDKIESFKLLFDQRKHAIRSFPGCHRLELLQSTDQPEIFFTYSYWDQPADLENYRASTLFQETWIATKKLFAQKAKAWSVEKLVVLE